MLSCFFNLFSVLESGFGDEHADDGGAAVVKLNVPLPLLPCLLWRVTAGDDTGGGGERARGDRGGGPLEGFDTRQLVDMEPERKKTRNEVSVNKILVWQGYSGGFLTWYGSYLGN